MALKLGFSGAIRCLVVQALLWSQVSIAQTVTPAPEPTVAQAQSFFTSMVEQHGTTSCRSYDPKGWNHEDYVKTLVKLENGTMIVQRMDHSTTHFDKGFDSYYERKSTSSFTLSDVSISIGKQDDTLIAGCQFPSAIKFHCLSGSCINETSDLVFHTGGVSIYDGSKFQDDPDHSVFSTSDMEIEINDAGISARILTAIQFYKQHSPSTQPSPF